MSWTTIIIFTIFIPPIGLFLMLLKFLEWARILVPFFRQTKKSGYISVPLDQPERNVKKLKTQQNVLSKKAKSFHIFGAILMILLGIVLAIQFWTILPGMEHWKSLIPTAAIFLVGGCLFLHGNRLQKRYLRCLNCLAFLDGQDSVDLDEMASAIGRSKKSILDDINWMTQTGMFDTPPVVDQGRNMFFKNIIVYRYFLDKQAKQKTEPVKAATSEYDNMLKEIRAANRQIEDPLFSAQLYEIEDTARLIFEEVEKHPEKKTEARKFFDYYLPTTLRLLQAYNKFQAAGMDGDNVDQTKEHIEEMMDNIDTMFKKQLSSLYEKEALDVDADIKVMEIMMQRDMPAPDFQVAKSI